MKIMRKILLAALVIVLIAGLALFMLRGVLIKSFARAQLEKLFGLRVDFTDLKVNKTASFVNVEVTGLKLYNPKGFADPVMMNMPGFYASCSLPDLFKGDFIFRELRLDINEFVVVRLEDATTNIGRFKGIARSKPEEAAEAKKHEFRIDLLKLQAGRLLFKDYTNDPPLVSVYILDIDKEYIRVSDPAKFLRLLVVESLLRTNIGSLFDVDLGRLKKNVDHVMRSSRDMVFQTRSLATNVVKQSLSTTGTVVKASLETATSLLPLPKRPILIQPKTEQVP
ncbi:MAG: hypothetical protein V1863_05810 [Candidatus Omnitrophota bacterium]